MRNFRKLLAEARKAQQTGHLEQAAALWADAQNCTENRQECEAWLKEMNLPGPQPAAILEPPRRRPAPQHLVPPPRFVTTNCFSSPIRIGVGALAIAACVKLYDLTNTAPQPSPATSSPQTESVAEVRPNPGAQTSIPAKLKKGNEPPRSAPKQEVVPVDSKTAVRMPPAQPFAHCQNPKDGQINIYIPPGKFVMGCSAGDEKCEKTEDQRHQVTLTKGFWLGETEVTQQAYKKVMGKSPSNSNSPDFPVDSVSWFDASSYCGKIDTRLPTEAEWEFAARAGEQSARYGNFDGIAWLSSNSGWKSHAVRGKLSNKWGLYDMLGNVAEWTADWWTDKYPPEVAVNPSGPASAVQRTLRGGSWISYQTDIRLSYRTKAVPEVQSMSIGFRCGGESLP